MKAVTRPRCTRQQRPPAQGKRLARSPRRHRGQDGLPPTDADMPRRLEHLASLFRCKSASLKARRHVGAAPQEKARAMRSSAVREPYLADKRSQAVDSRARGVPRGKARDPRLREKRACRTSRGVGRTVPYGDAPVLFVLVECTSATVQNPPDYRPKLAKDVRSCAPHGNTNVASGKDLESRTRVEARSSQRMTGL